MKRLTILLFATLLVFAACKKSDVTSPTDNNDDSQTDELVKWEFKSDDKGFKDYMALDNSDNMYFLDLISSSESKLKSVNKNGKLLWSVTINSSYSYDSQISIYNDKLILAHDKKTISVYNLSDGALLWTNQLAYEIYNFSVNAGIIYVATASFSYSKSKLYSFNVNSSSVILEILYDKTDYMYVSSKGANICLTKQILEGADAKISICLCDDNGVELWNAKFLASDYSEEPTMAIFDDEGNVYFEESANDNSTNIHSYKVAGGALNWENQLTTDDSNRSLMLYSQSQSKIIVAYNSITSTQLDDIKIIDIASGNVDAVIAEVNSGNRTFLTGSNTFIVFNQTSSSLPKMYEYDLSGSIIKTTKINQVIGNTSHYKDAKINSAGDLLIFGKGMKVYCLDTKFTSPKVNDWHSVNGNNQNMNSL